PGIRNRQKSLQSCDRAVGFTQFCGYARENFNWSGATHRVFLNRKRSYASLRKIQSGGFITKAHGSQREIAEEEMMFRLFFKERFQFATCLFPASFGSNGVTGNVLSPP